MKSVMLVALLLSVMLFGGCAYMNGAASNEDLKEQLLRQRVAERWQSMVDDNKSKTYEYYDPFFRSVVTPENMPGLKSPAKYYSFDIKGIEMQGNVAFVDVEIEYSYSLIGSLGQKIERERTKSVFTNTWLYMDGTWWLKFVDAITDGTFAQY